MSEIVDATCEASVVTADGVPVEIAEILSKGLGSSSGVLVIREGKAVYIANTVADLETTIDKLISALNQLVTIITAVGAGMTGPTTAPPPTLATDLAGLTTLATELTTLKGQLK